MVCTTSLMTRLKAAIRPICVWVSGRNPDQQYDDRLRTVVEYNIQANNTEGLTTSHGRLAFAGVKVGDYGSFDYGRNYGVLYDVEGWTDMLPEFGGDSYPPMPITL